jgi:UDP-N-acetylmuramoyl-L-alanyl-D-glutamate--2,6-diaminopimelate ligase
MLFSELVAGEFVPELLASIEVQGLADDSRKVAPGDVFIAVKGHDWDGNQYIQEAIKRGAAIIVSDDAQSKNLVSLGVPFYLVGNAARFLVDAAINFYGNPAANIKLIGITGTNGKTSTSIILRQLIGGTDGGAGLIGTIENIVGERHLPVTNTTPGVLELQRLLYEMRKAGQGYSVMEVSSHALDQERVNGCSFTAAVFTNLTQDHLDYHGDMDSYAKTKQKLFTEYLLPGAYSVVNADCPYGKIMRVASNSHVKTYGIFAQADFVAQEIKSSLAGLSFKIVHEGKNYRVDSKFSGKFGVYNILAAFSTAVCLGIDPDLLVARINAMNGVPGRFERVPGSMDFAVFVDYAHTPDGLENILQTAKEFTESRIIVVFGCGGDRDKTKRPIMGTIAAKYADQIYVTSDNPRTEDAQDIIEDIIAGIDSEGRKKTTIIVNRQQAISEAIAFAHQGDTVLIAGKGHEDYQIIGRQKNHFDDREEAGKALAQRGSSR